jgi:Amidase
MTTPDDATKLCFLPATELAARIRRREVSPVEVVDAYLRRIEQRNPLINAYTLVLADEARSAACAAERAVASGGPVGPLHGVPVAIKDLDDVAGVQTSMGSLAIRNRIPKRSAVVVERLLAAGAIILGKTNTPEFGHKGITDNLRGLDRPIPPGRSGIMQAVRPAAARLPSPMDLPRWRRAPTAAARSGYRHPLAASLASKLPSAEFPPSRGRMRSYGAIPSCISALWLELLLTRLL